MEASTDQSSESTSRAGDWMDGEAEPGANGGAAVLERGGGGLGAPDAWQLAGGDVASGGSSAALMAGPPEIENSHARLAEPEDTIAERIAQLPALWMRRYALALFELRGSPFQARKRVAQQGGAISAGSVDRAAAKDPNFAALIEEAIRNRDEELVDCVWKGATDGDEQPIYQQGQHVGNRRVRSPKDAELYMKYRGMISDEPRQSTNIRVTVNQAADAAPRAAAVAAALFGARAAQPPLLDAATGQRVA